MVKFLLRYDLVTAPTLDSENCTLMRPPDGPRSHDGEVPHDDIALRIAGDQAAVASDERCRVDLSLVAAENGLWGWRGVGHF